MQFLDVACRPSIPQDLNTEMRIASYIHSFLILFIMPDGSELAQPE